MFRPKRIDEGGRGLTNLVKAFLLAHDPGGPATYPLVEIETAENLIGRQLDELEKSLASSFLRLKHSKMGGIKNLKIKQLPNLQIQRAGKSEHCTNCRVDLAPFNTTDLPRVNPTAVRQLFLRKATLHPFLTNALAEFFNRCLIPYPYHRAKDYNSVKNYKDINVFISDFMLFLFANKQLAGIIGSATELTIDLFEERSTNDTPTTRNRNRHVVIGLGWIVFNKVMQSVFLRYGGLSLRTQKGYDPHSERFHSPPARRGIYAFPQKAVELFLLGGNYGGRSSKQKRQVVRHFTHNGVLWHHFGDHCPPNEIMARHGSWVKTTVRCWQKAFRKKSLQNRYWSVSGLRHVQSIGEPLQAGVSGIISKDHYEVFFDEKVG